ncbi:hypothetical protein Rsub_04152 [Raphidocelis subcapitata]|uniref:Plastid lipid-associated protein/fibrillin conserved domain-containing protein n=1 Tax=Raphidocelis subcapitata TaxID=307507 RepID=A0A2V0NXL1_9CHLO|nr:hypothetical protein Rsub_04152 [Raphidocelis subcapitata]|eukprot:GBF91412.1 hypothetical protein Rsub_04152 [Raphidocelis subcapitata]
MRAGRRAPIHAAAAPAAAFPWPRRPLRSAARAQPGEGAAAPPAAAAAAAGGGAEEVKKELRAALEGLDRGIFGTTAAKREAVLSLVARLEALNPLPQPLRRMDALAGEWRLLYTTIAITGVKKTKLGLREFVKLGDFVQIIDTENHAAINRVSFSVAGFAKFGGSLTINAAYAPAPPPLDGSRVEINFSDAKLTPEALEALFRANYDLLLSIFNPQGWLDVTYVDEEVRVGRDDKGHVFVVERC